MTCFNKVHLILEDVQHGGFEHAVHAHVCEAFIQVFSAPFPFFLTINTCYQLTQSKYCVIISVRAGASGTDTSVPHFVGFIIQHIVLLIAKQVEACYGHWYRPSNAPQ
jgi:hypothetical protein